MIAVPADTPEIIPELEPAVATELLLLLHVPPVVASDKVMEWPVQIMEGPVMADGEARTKTTVEVEQPVGSV
jgi:hypothetical protein